MEPETLLKLCAILIALGILMINFIDFNWLIDNLLNKKQDNTTPEKPEVEKDDKLFLNIVDLWYKLKENCESYGLKNATNKLDEVFPLLNDKNIEE